jgi:hypothetical protein
MESRRFLLFVEDSLSVRFGVDFHVVAPSEPAIAAFDRARVGFAFVGPVAVPMSREVLNEIAKGRWQSSREAKEIDLRVEYSPRSNETVCRKSRKRKCSLFQFYWSVFPLVWDFCPLPTQERPGTPIPSFASWLPDFESF